MRFSCQVQVINYKMPVSGPHMQPKAKRSTLTLGGYGGSDVGGKLWILHQNAQNGAGVRYKVNSNVVTIHIKFLHEGKMTIRLREPTVDLKISGEPAEVTKFAKTIGAFRSGNPLPAVGPMKIANLETVSKKMEPPPKKYLAVLESKELKLIKNGYPATLTELLICNVDMKVVDPKIFRLPHLKVLRLECTQISVIPKSIELLTGLTQLHLKGNCLGLSKRIEDWDWLRSKPLQASLKVLDLSFNQLKMVPDTLAHLQALITLKLDDNSLIRLPNNLGFAKNLRNLSLRKNLLRWIPVSLLRAGIVGVDLSENNFALADSPEYLKNIPEPTPSSISLRDLAARAVIQHRLDYDDTALPIELIRHLEGACYCHCGKATFPSWPSKFVLIHSNKVWSCVTYNQTTSVIVGIRTCLGCKNGVITLHSFQRFR